MTHNSELNNLESIWYTIRETIHDIENGRIRLHFKTIQRLSGTGEVKRHWPVGDNGNRLKALCDIYFDNVRFELNFSSDNRFSIVLTFLKNHLAVETLKFGNAPIPGVNGKPVHMGFLMGENRPPYRCLKELRRDIVCLTAYAAIKQTDRQAAEEMFCDVIRLEPESHDLFETGCRGESLN